MALYVFQYAGKRGKEGFSLIVTKRMGEDDDGPIDTLIDPN